MNEYTIYTILILKYKYKFIFMTYINRNKEAVLK